MKQNPYDLSEVGKKLASDLRTGGPDRPQQVNPYDLNRPSKDVPSKSGPPKK